MTTKGGTACQKGTLPSPGDTTWMNGSKTHHGAGWAVVTPTFQQYGRLAGPQTSYRGDLMGYCRAGDVLQDGTIVLDNQAVQNVAHQTPHREALDTELRVEAAHTTTDKCLTSRWMSSHQDIARAKDDKERLDIKTNDVADRLAKKGTALPVPQGQPSHDWSIFVAGGDAPTPAKKWIHQLYQMERRDTGVMAAVEGSAPAGMEALAMGTNAVGRMRGMLPKGAEGAVHNMWGEP